VHSGVPPQDPAEQTTPAPVALSARVTLQSRGAGAATLQVAGPAHKRDPGRATDARRICGGSRGGPVEPDPAVEQEIFEYGVNDLPADVLPPLRQRCLLTRERTRSPASERRFRPEGKVTVNAQTIGRKSRRLRSAVGRSVRANGVTIILSVASLVLLIDEKLASLRDERTE